MRPSRVALEEYRAASIATVRDKMEKVKLRQMPRRRSRRMRARKRPLKLVTFGMFSGGNGRLLQDVRQHSARVCFCAASGSCDRQSVREHRIDETLHIIGQDETARFDKRERLSARNRATRAAWTDPQFNIRVFPRPIHD